MLGGGGDSEVGEVGQGGVQSSFRFHNWSQAVVILSMFKEHIDLIQPMGWPRPCFLKLPPCQAFTFLALLPRTLPFF